MAEPEPEGPTVDIPANLVDVNAKIAAASEKAGRPPPTLVAVSKTKPLDDVLAAFASGQCHFGENYIQELMEKSEATAEKADLRWHFIGSLQSNKCKQLAGCPNLFLVHTVPSAKTAAKLNAACEELRAGKPPLGILIQVNTSNEESKGGVAPADAAAACKAVVDSCPALDLKGLMCIGKYGEDSSEDFTCLIGCRDGAAEAIGVDPAALGLSMGMSHDFEQAIEFGATYIRPGSTIFGARTLSNAGKA